MLNAVKLSLESVTNAGEGFNSANKNYLSPWPHMILWFDSLLMQKCCSGLNLMQSACLFESH